jgi:hypothetical protein
MKSSPAIKNGAYRYPIQTDIRRGTRYRVQMTKPSGRVMSAAKMHSERQAMAITTDRSCSFGVEPNVILIMAGNPDAVWETYSPQRYEYSSIIAGHPCHFPEITGIHPAMLKAPGFKKNAREFWQNFIEIMMVLQITMKLLK